MRSPVLLAGLLALALASSATAQIQATGQGVGPPTFDANWQVSSSPFGANAWSAWSTAYIGTNPPSPPWAPNVEPAGPRWISAWANFIAPNGTGDNASRWEYQFRTAIGAGGTYSLELGWDNRLVGLYQAGASATGGSLVGPLYVSPDPSKSAFCRDSDGLTPSAAWPNCFVDAFVTVNQGGWLVAHVVGDGQTDGFRLTGDKGSTTAEVVPEPATMTLLATGLIGMAGSSIRRRRKSPKA